jgi:hypothetical protein
MTLPRVGVQQREGHSVAGWDVRFMSIELPGIDGYKDSEGVIYLIGRCMGIARSVTRGTSSNDREFLASLMGPCPPLQYSRRD